MKNLWSSDSRSNWNLKMSVYEEGGGGGWGYPRRKDENQQMSPGIKTKGWESSALTAPCDLVSILYGKDLLQFFRNIIALEQRENNETESKR